MNQEFLHKRLEERKQQHAFRQLRLPGSGIDFCSNDYLGIVKNNLLENVESAAIGVHGSTGSRLLSGNYPLIEDTEKIIANFHGADAALIFNSGYDANLGLLSCVPQRGDTILYDQYSHASIRDGIRLSHAASFSFRHNDLEDLEKKLGVTKGNIFIVTESVFSMDGDMAPLEEMIRICENHQALLIVDEAHATGVIGNKGEGLVQMLNLQHKCFARIHTFGKALGCHGAVVLGSDTLIQYLVNFSRPFIYTTALPPVAVDAIKSAYAIFPKLNKERSHLKELITLFQSIPVNVERPPGTTPIQVLIIPGNEPVKRSAARLQQQNLDVRAILYPTVPRERERLRIVIHSFNTHAEIRMLLEQVHLEK